MGNQPGITKTVFGFDMFGKGAWLNWLCLEVDAYQWFFARANRKRTSDMVIDRDIDINPATPITRLLNRNPSAGKPSPFSVADRNAASRAPYSASFTKTFT